LNSDSHPNGPTPLVRVDGVTKTYPAGVRALSGVSFSVEPGEFVVLLGPSGAGKTTLFRCLTGLTRPDRGSLEIHKRDICSLGGRDLRTARREVAMIFQQFNLIRRLTALQNVLAGRLAVLPTWRVLVRSFARVDRQMALRCLDTVGLLDKAYTRADHLSGGQQQRVAIARALAQEATVVLADEPVASLDPESAATVLDTLRSVAARGVAVIASLHQVGLATDYADRIIALRDGRVLEDAPRGAFDSRALEQIYERSDARVAEPARG